MLLLINIFVFSWLVTHSFLFFRSYYQFQKVYEGIDIYFNILYYNVLLLLISVDSAF